MRELRREPVVVREIELALRAKGSAVVIDSARGRMAGGGLLTAKGEFDLGEAGAWTARLDAERVSLDGSLVPVVATFWPFASSAGGHLQGLVTAGVDLKGKGVTWESVKPSMTGSGEIRLTQLQLPRESVLGQVAHFFDQGGAAGLGLNDAGAQFSIDQGWVSFNRLSASGEKARYDLAGRVSLEGKLDLRIDLLPIAKAFGESTYRDIAKHMDELIVNVRGTTTKPSLAMPDMEALLKKVAEDALSNEIKKALDRLR